MLKEWFWWQIEASLEHMDEDTCISLSDITIGFWMALSLAGCMSGSLDQEVSGPGWNSESSAYNLQRTALFQCLS